MKTSSLKTLALLAAISFPCVAFAEYLGAPLFSTFDGGALLGVFSVLVLGLISVADYSRRSRIATVRARCGRTAACEVHRLAA